MLSCLPHDDVSHWLCRPSDDDVTFTLARTSSSLLHAVIIADTVSETTFDTPELTSLSVAPRGGSGLVLLLNS